MELVLQILIGIIAVFHLYVMWLEMFAWTTRAPKVFTNFPKELFPQTKTLAANQGLYNGFLAAGLIWSFFVCHPQWQFHVRLFFLACVLIAGIYGAFTASKKIFFVQALPALITIILMHFVPMKCGHGCCKNEKDSGSEIRGYYIGNYSHITDLMTLKELKRKELNDGLISKKDSVIDTISFGYSGKRHEVILCTNLPTAGVDGDVIYAKLDNVGIIYNHALTWKKESYLYTNNDSLNHLITHALFQITANRMESEQKSGEMEYYPIKPLAYIK